MVDKKINNFLIKDFWELHPEVEEIEVKIFEKGQVCDKHGNYNKETIHKLNCSNRFCKEGDWFGINEILNKVVSSKKPEWEKKLISCKGHDEIRGCGNSATLKIKVKYKK